MHQKPCRSRTTAAPSFCHDALASPSPTSLALSDGRFPAANAAGCFGPVNPAFQHHITGHLPHRFRCERPTVVSAAMRYFAEHFDKAIVIAETGFNVLDQRRH